MKNIHALYLVFVAVFLLCLTGCDPAYPPVVINRYAGPINVSLEFVNDPTPLSGTLQPATELVQHRKGLILNKITLSAPLGRTHIYQSADLDSLRAKQKSGFEVWILSDSGLALGDKSDMEKLYSAKRK